MAAETTPLLGTQASSEAKKEEPVPGWISMTPTWAVFIGGLLISASFGVTQTPILYAFRQMVCEDYYRHNPPYTGTGDRCEDNRAIESGAIAQYAILGSCTVFFAITNLFITGWQMRTLGPKTALLLRNFFPIVRVSLQFLAIGIGGATGITIFQAGQAVSIVGGPAGYILVLNTIMAEIVEQAQRTSMFGQLQGCIMLGNAIGFLVGGIVSDQFGVDSPFRLSAICLAATWVFCALCVPSITLNQSDAAKKKTANNLRSNAFVAAFIDPIRALGPQKLRLSNGTITIHYGTTILAAGIFVGVLATAYVGQLLQQYSMSAFHFEASQNSALMALTLVVRGLFLMFIFPVIISRGRKWFDKSIPPTSAATRDAEAIIPTHPADLDPAPPLVSAVEEPVQAPAAPPTPESGEFDLFFLRYSYLVDGVLTMCAAFISEGWQFYLRKSVLLKMVNMLHFVSFSATKMNLP